MCVGACCEIDAGLEGYGDDFGGAVRHGGIFGSLPKHWLGQDGNGSRRERKWETSELSQKVSRWDEK